MIKFGTDGWRAIIADQFTFANVEKVTQAYTNYLGNNAKLIIIGYDNRFLSEKFAERAAEILSSNGIQVLLANSSSPTPAMSFAVKEKNASGGIMITASHNPPIWNGFKIKGSFGGSVSMDVTKEIENILSKEISVKKGNASNISNFDPKTSYIKNISKFVDINLFSRSKMKVIVDPMFGSGIGYLSNILKDKMDILEINNYRDPYFGGINPEPLAINLKKLMNTCKDKNIFGIALDGDSDRIAAVGADGAFINTHQVFALLLYHLVKNKKMTGEVVKTFNMSFLINKMCSKYGFKLHETPIGFKHICDLMLSRNILMGGEESGGMAIKGNIPERDAPLVALMLIELCAIEKLSLEQILENISKEFGGYYYNRVDLHLNDEQKQRTISLLKNNPPKSFAGEEVAEIQNLDGIKLIFKDRSWVLFRASGTEPLLRIYCEANSQEKVNLLLDEGKRLAQK